MGGAFKDATTVDNKLTTSQKTQGRLRSLLTKVHHVQRKMTRADCTHGAQRNTTWSSPHNAHLLHRRRCCHPPCHILNHHLLVDCRLLLNEEEEARRTARTSSGRCRSWLSYANLQLRASRESHTLSQQGHPHTFGKLLAQATLNAINWSRDSDKRTVNPNFNIPTKAATRLFRPRKPSRV